MTKKNKIILTSVGVITPVTILTITLPIVLSKNKSSDKTKIGAIFDKLKGLENNKIYIINPSETELDLSKKIDKDKIIKKIKNDYKLTSEDAKKLIIEGTGKVTKNEFKDIKVKITINQESKTIDFKVKIVKNVNAIKLDKLIIKISNKEISINNNIGHDLTTSDGRAKILTAIKNNLSTNKIINKEEENALISIATSQGKISSNWLSINFNVKYGDEERAATLKVKNKYFTKDEEQQFIDDLTSAKIKKNDGININKKILPPTKNKATTSKSIQTYINNYINDKIKDKAKEWDVSYKKDGSNDKWVADDDDGSLTYTIVLKKHTFQNKEIIVEYGNGSFKGNTNLQYLDFTKIEVVDAIISALEKDKAKFASENEKDPTIKTGGNTITLPKTYTKTPNNITNLKIKSIGTWKKEKFYILVSNVVITDGNIEKNYKEIKLDSFKFEADYNTMDGEDVSRITKWPSDLSNIKWYGVVGLSAANTPFKSDISLKNIGGSGLKGVDISQVTKWPSGLSNINWDGVVGLSAANTPFKGEIHLKDIKHSYLKGVDISQVTKWPSDLRGINWDGVVGLSATNTPFKGDISKSIGGSGLKGVDISQVTKWPSGLSSINWDGVVGLSATNTPFKGEIHLKDIKYSYLKGVDISQVTKWPSDLRGINWDGVVGLSAANTPFKSDISLKRIRKLYLKGVDISQVTKWPSDLRDINWDGVVGLSATNTPFKGEILKDIRGSYLKGVDISQVTKWPSDLQGIEWEGVKYKENSSGLNSLSQELQQKVKNKGIKLK